MNAGKTKLLLVDDLRDNLMALEAVLARPDREIHQALSADQALTLLLQHEFALAILDVQMPGMNGFELAEMMRGTARTRNIPIIFVSAGGAELNYPFRSYASGAIDFLYKPLDTQAVQSKVQILIELYEQRRAILLQVEALEASRREQAELLARLETTQQELKQAVAMRDDFMSVVAHELRTPLNTLILQTQLRKMKLTRGEPAPSPEALMGWLERDERLINSLVRLIDDMLDVSRIRTGRLTLRPETIELTGLVRKVMESFDQQLETAGCPLHVTAEEPIEGLWDAFRMEQVLVNLLSNALRYGSGKPIEVCVSRDAEGACVTVRDYGSGIPPEFHAAIFRPFERASADRAITGLGLGLFICEQIIASHQGTIDVESAPGEGALFRVRLPLAPANVQSAAIAVAGIGRC